LIISATFPYKVLSYPLLRHSLRSEAFSWFSFNWGKRGREVKKQSFSQGGKSHLLWWITDLPSCGHRSLYYAITHAGPVKRMGRVHLGPHSDTH
jgi:hypothetical protein